MLKLPALAAVTLAAAPALAGSDCLDIGSATETAYLITQEGDQSMCGDMFELGGLTSERHSKREDAIWFKLDGQSWVVRDPTVVAEGRRLFAPVAAIGREQGRLGAEQGKLGAQQGKIGAEQGMIGAKQAAAALRAAYDEAAAEPEDYSARMAELGRKMGELGRQQGVLGKQQGALGERLQRELAVAQDGLSKLLVKAMKDGTAVRVTRL